MVNQPSPFPLIHFLSDVHLHPDGKVNGDLFLYYLRNEAPHASQIFILGDLFEAWPGDDCIDSPAYRFTRNICEEFRKLAASGIRIFVMHGNRDFLLGQHFCKTSLCTLISDPFQINLGGHAVILSHGDRYCTDDLAYQNFRQQVRSTAWKTQFLAKPLNERIKIADMLRLQSNEEKQKKPASYGWDLNETALLALSNQASTFKLIHGHTHQPATHNTPLERWVLAEWLANDAEIVIYVNDKLERKKIKLPPK